MELTFKDLKRRDVINVSDGKSLGNITNINISFPKGIMTGIMVPGKRVNCITRIFSKGSLYIPDNKIIRIGNDVILVDLKCGDYCAESTNVKSQKNNSFYSSGGNFSAQSGSDFRSPPCPPPCPPNNPCQNSCPPCPPPCPPHDKSFGGRGDSGMSVGNFQVNNSDDDFN